MVFAVDASELVPISAVEASLTAFLIEPLVESEPFITLIDARFASTCVLISLTFFTKPDVESPTVVFKLLTSLH